jgi:catechol 2,3-dioxygenase-like lactoylglutathione lyase family enzyme
MNKDNLEFVQVKAVTLAAGDLARAIRFYGEVLGLRPETGRDLDAAFLIGDTIILLKAQADWYAKPSAELNPRITLEVKDAYEMESVLRARGVTISDTVKVYDKNPVGAFLDSEGNKLWFCSDTGG